MIYVLRTSHIWQCHFLRSTRGIWIHALNINFSIKLSQPVTVILQLQSYSWLSSEVHCVADRLNRPKMTFPSWNLQTKRTAYVKSVATQHKYVVYFCAYGIRIFSETSRGRSPGYNVEVTFGRGHGMTSQASICRFLFTHHEWSSQPLINRNFQRHSSK